LSFKQCQPNPWEEFNVTYRNGSKLRGKISFCSEDLGLFVDLPGGLTGLVHKSNLSYLDSWKEELDKYEVGQEIDVFLIGVDLKAQRISLGIKQLGADPYQVYEQKCRQREPVSATVSKIQEKSARVRFDDGIEGLLPIGEVSKDHIDKIEDNLSVGDKIEVLVINVEKRKVVVSLKAHESASAQADMSQHSSDDEGVAAAAKKKTSFGAMVKETLGMEEAAARAAQQTQEDASEADDGAAEPSGDASDPDAADGDSVDRENA
jgi:small subunit ribosomal protein S1